MNNLPSKEVGGNEKMLIHQESFHSFSGPLPPPDILERFNNIVPGAAERIISMAEQQFAHRIDLEKKVIISDIDRSKWGQILGFIISIFGLAIALFLGISGQQWVGSIIGGGTLASLVGVFMYGTKSRNKERADKSKTKKE